MLALNVPMEAPEDQQALYDSSYRYYFYDQRYTLFMALEPPKGGIVMLGNSLTNGGNWDELFPGRGLINRGISGDNTFGILARLHEIIAIQPEKLFILIGINDIARNTPLPVIFENYRRILQRLADESPGTRVFVQSLLPTNDAFSQFPGAQGKDHQIRALNEFLRQLTEERNIGFIDLYFHFLDEEGRLDKRFTNDGLHLLGEGYLHWAELLRTYIEP